MQAKNTRSKKSTIEFLISEDFYFIIFFLPTHFNSEFLQDLSS